MYVILNEFCSRNGLEFKYFEQLSDKVNLYKFRLEIRKIHSKILKHVFYGYGPSKKAAKESASIDAIRELNIYEKLVDVFAKHRFRLKKNQIEIKNPNSPVINGSNDLRSNESSVQNVNNSTSNLNINDQFKNWKQSFRIPANYDDGSKDSIEKKLFGKHIYDLYLNCKKLKLRPKIKFVYSKVTQTDDLQIFVKISVLGYESKLGKGKTDLGAIEDAAEKFILRSTNEIDEDIEDNSIDCYNVLNQIHLKTKKEFKSVCLLSIEKSVRFYLYKCQLGDLVSYGLDEFIDYSQNNAANQILNNLKNNLNDEIVKLKDQVDEIRDRIHEKENFLYLISSEMNKKSDLKSQTDDDDVTCLTL